MKIALIDVSHWHAPLYIEAFASSPDEIVGISDRDPAVAARVAERLQCRAWGDYRAMLAEARPDFVFSFGRHVEMPEIAVQLIESGLPFAMEKPMGRTAADVERVHRLAQAKSAFIAVPFVMRHSPVLGALDALIASGEFGEVTNAYARFIAGPPDRYLRANSGWMLDPAQSGGGCAINLGVHFVDLFMQLIRQRRFDRVYAMASNSKYGLAIEDFSTIVLSTADGVVCTIETGYAYPSIPGRQRHFACCITTTKGYLELRDGACSWAGHDGRRFEKPVVTETDAYYPVFIAHTLDAFRAGRRPAASTGEMLDVMRVLDAAYESGRRGEAVKP